MSKFFRCAMTAMLIVGNISALEDTQKTTLVLRDHRFRAANFTTFHELKAKTKDFASKFQMAAIYHETTDSSELGEVFGTKGRNTIIVGTPAQVTAGTADVENNFLLKDISPADNTLEGTIVFKPKQIASGTNIEVIMDFGKFLKGLYFKESLVFMNVKNDIGVTFCNEKTGANSNESHRIIDILSGKNLERDLDGVKIDNVNEQAPLLYAKLCGDNDRTGIQNIESMLGWHFLKKDDCYAGINIAIQSPTGDRTTAETLWEPRLGSKHWGLGLGLDAGATIWDNTDKSLKILFEFNYRYQFEANEKRTLGIKNVLTEAKYCSHALSHYYLLGKVGKYISYPAANVLTKDVDVKPGSMIDTFVDVNFNMNGFIFDLGYNLFWKEAEEVTLERCKWTDNTYGIINPESFVTCSYPFALSDALPANTAVNFVNIDTSVAESPSMLTHSIYGSLGYIFKKWDNPFMVAIGGAYELGDDRGAADSYTLWLKGGIGF